MGQKTLADEGFERFRKPTRRDQFLAEMEAVIPREDLCRVILPFYPLPVECNGCRKKKHPIKNPRKS